MERNMKIRKWIIYSGVFFLALSTVITIVSSSSKFNAKVARELCFAETDVNGDGIIDEADCEGGGTGGGGTEPNPCLEEVVTAESTSIPVGEPEPGECVCQEYEPFPPAHDAATESVHQATVTKTDTDAKSELDKIIKEVSRITGLDKNIAELKRLISLYTQTPSDELARRIVTTYKSILEFKLSDPVTLAKIQTRVLNPVKLFEESLYEAIQLPTEDKKYRSDPWEGNSDRRWRLFTNVTPDLSGINYSWPADIKITGINLKVKNTLASSAGFSLCVESSLGIGGRGTGSFSFTGLSFEYRRGTSGASLSFSTNGSVGIFGTFPLPGGNQ
jgi:hypothetical protein